METTTPTTHLNLSTCRNPVFVPKHAFETEYFMLNFYQDCLLAMCSLPQQEEDLFCPPLFDGVGCWPATKVNSTRHIRCPDIPFYDQSKFGRHDCVMENSTPTWSSHPNYPGLIWSDYSQCEQALMKNNYEVVQLIYYIGHLLSFIFTFLAFLIFALFKKLHCARNVIHMNFFGSIALFCFNYFLQIILIDQLLKEKLLCNFIHLVVQYSFQSTYFWMLSEAAFLHRTVVTNVFGSNEKVKRFFVLGWGCPVLVMIAYATANIAQGKAKVCWIEKYGETLSLIVEIPLLLCIATNLILLLSVLRVLIPKLHSSDAPGQDVALKSAKAIIFLSPLFGVHTIITLWMPREGTTAHDILGVIQALLQSFQGFFVAIVFCFGNSEVRNEVKSNFMRQAAIPRRRSTETTMGGLTLVNRDVSPPQRSVDGGAVFSSTNL